MAYTERDLVLSCFSGLEFMVPQILRSGVNVNCNYTGITPLSSAADHGYKEICEILIAHGADINQKNEYGESPLILAASKGYFEVCELLIQNGADINVVNNLGLSALSLAAEKGNNEICELLLTHGSDNIQNAFIHAIFCKKREVCELFIANGVEVDNIYIFFMKQNEWFDLCLKLKREKAFKRRKHLVDFYYSFWN